ncbi:MAG: ABC transporter ATP-binding protein [Planctomycetota bacterium]
MPDDTIIRVDGLWKRYGLPLPGFTGRGRDSGMWALRDVNLEIRRGEIFGIIGRNGAGKSTLLKVLAGVSPPTRGRVEVTGRVFPMIELNAGLHMELTGRENVRLLGMIMGLSRRDIEAKMPEIEAFCELGEWFDRPARMYSSGMVARLGFAVAMNVEADVLLVDEVLAVGDLALQRKCYESMSRFRASPKTVVLVSHNLNQIERMCGRTLLLHDGRIVSSGSPPEIVYEYRSRMMDEISKGRSEIENVESSGELHVVGVELMSSGEKEVGDVVVSRSRLRIVIKFRLIEPVFTTWHIGFLTSSQGVLWASELLEFDLTDKASGEYQVVCDIRDMAIRPGHYTISLIIRSKKGHVIQRFPSLKCFRVRRGNEEKLLQTTALVYLDHDWRLL